MAKVVFAGIVRDCAPYLAAVLENVERISSQFTDAAFVFVENDSVDATKQILQSWGATRRNFSLVDLSGLGKLPIRTLRLEFARNVYLEMIRSDARLQDFDVLCLLDMDDVCIHPIALSDLNAALDFMRGTKDCAGVFSNQTGIYLDMWAFRHSEYCPADVWFEVQSWALKYGSTDAAAYANTFAKRLRSFPRALAPFEVESAFGGLALYSLDYVRRAPNPYLGSCVRVMRGNDQRAVPYRMQQCEHVHFNAGLRHLGGRLFVVPALINQVTPAAMSFPSSAHRTLRF